MDTLIPRCSTARTLDLAKAAGQAWKAPWFVDVPLGAFRTSGGWGIMRRFGRFIRDLLLLVVCLGVLFGAVLVVAYGLTRL